MRKLMEKFLGWPKLDSVLRQGKVRGLKRVDWFNRPTMAAYNLMRMRRLILIESLASQGRSVPEGQWKRPSGAKPSR
jgi:hypothetical protein